MAETNIVVFRGREIVIPEMPISRIRALLDELIKRSETPGEPRADLVGGQLFEDISLRELHLITGITEEQMEQATPASLRPVVDKIMELNPDYIALRYRLAAIGDELQRVSVE